MVEQTVYIREDVEAEVSSQVNSNFLCIEIFIPSFLSITVTVTMTPRGWRAHRIHTKRSSKREGRQRYIPIPSNYKLKMMLFNPEVTCLDAHSNLRCGWGCSGGRVLLQRHSRH